MSKERKQGRRRRKREVVFEKIEAKKAKI